MKKLQSRLFFTYFVLTFMIVSVILFCFYHYIYQQMTEDVKASRIETVSHAADTIDHLTNMLLFAISIGPFQNQFQDMLTEEMPEDPYERLLIKQQAEEIFRNYSATYQNLQISYYATLIGFNGFQYSSAAAFRYDLFCQAPWIDSVLEANGRVVWIPTQPDPYATFSHKPIYIMSRAIRCGRRLVPAGILSIMIDEDALYRTYSTSISPDTNYFIVDGDKTIVSHKDKELIGTCWDSPVPLDMVQSRTEQAVTGSSAAGGEILISCRRLASSNWWLVESIPIHTLIKTSSRFLKIMVFIAFICTITSLLISYSISRYLTRPMEELDRGMKEVSQGNLQLRLAKKTDDDLGRLIDGFNHMTQEFDHLIHRIKEQANEKRIAEIHFLQAQINPHFIYNTLNSVRCMTMMNNTNDAAKILVFVIHMMRTVLSGEKMFVPLDSELATLRDYIEIQKIVYSHALEMEINISPAVHMSMVPKMILQPIVENSVFHGIVRNELDGLIQIHAYKEEENDLEILHIIVSDNGHMERDVYLSLKERLESNTEKSLSNKNHIGLSNVLLRIRQIYGEQYGLEILKADNKQTSIHLWFPNQIYAPDINPKEADYD
ncbi:MAG: histidine kinase [Lachnospiraceae bacterium]|jgi:two-component system sensor histidine kinase YesM|nr:histidine kinase [Lachnospiraceae bacterium]